MYKKGDIIQSTSKSKEGLLYIILKVVESDGLLLTVPISIGEKMHGKWVIDYNDSGKIFYAKYNKFSNFKIENVKLCNLSMRDSHGFISKIYDIRKDNLSLIKEEQRNKIRAKKKKKQEVNSLSKMVNKRVIKKTDFKKRPGLHDPIYKGNITIVRG